LLKVVSVNAAVERLVKRLGDFAGGIRIIFQMINRVGTLHTFLKQKNAQVICDVILQGFHDS
jgi:hypothetical protein